jgi:hypothetical protein
LRCKYKYKTMNYAIHSTKFILRVNPDKIPIEGNSLNFKDI